MLDVAKMFGWLKKKQLQLDPECRWIIESDEKTIRITDRNGAFKELPKTELSGVIIETNDTGPCGMDVWWLLFGADSTVAATFPQGAMGEDVLIEYLSALPGFDRSAMINAMASTDNYVFPVWRTKNKRLNYEEANKQAKGSH